MIGSPIPNYTAYVLDENLNPLPVGAVGELYIGGVGLSRGYLNNQELTSQRFIKNPFQTQDDKRAGYNDRIYRTGDLVRYMPDGNIEYIGRNDFQVKIRGFRIELGEIEARIAEITGIRQTVVMARENANASKYLVAYYTAENEIDKEFIREQLAKNLPDYMVPAAFIQMQDFPLTVNGKLDRKAMPDPSFTDEDNYVAPKNQMQETLCKIYAEVLGLDYKKVGMLDDFFQLGGDSISSIQLVNRIRQAFDINISVKEIFKFKVIGKLYDNLVADQAFGTKNIINEQGILSGQIPMMPIQNWFIQNIQNGTFPLYNHWNQAFLLDVPTLDKDILEESIIKLIQHHDAFRIAFQKTGLNFTQYYNEQTGDGFLETADVSAMDEQKVADLMDTWQAGLDILNGKLFHVGYITGLDNGRARIHFVMHHLIVDAVSWRIIKNDLQAIYEYIKGNYKSEEVDTTEILGKKGTSYRQWAEIIYKHFEQDNHANTTERAYWDNITEEVSHSNKALELLADQQRNTAVIQIDRKTTDALLREVNMVYGIQINDILLAAMAKAMAELTGRNLNHILMEGHGREEILPQTDISNTMGWFTSMFPVKLAYDAGLSYGQRLAMVKDSLREIPDNGIGYGFLVGYQPELMPKVCFNYLGQFDGNDADSEVWTFAMGEPSGIPVDKRNSDNYIVNINGGVTKGMLG